MNKSSQINRINNINYNILMEQKINSLNGKRPQLLLHSCCAPCSSSVIERLYEFFDLSVLYYNPNIFPNYEYEKRLEEQIKLLKILRNIPCIEIGYSHEEFLNICKEYETEPEGGKRCDICIFLRLEKTVKYAENKGFEYFATTLSVSPHKSAENINNTLKCLSEIYNVKPLFADFKKKNGYKRSIELSNLYGIYRQDYCGCEFSL